MTDRRGAVAIGDNKQTGRAGESQDIAGRRLPVEVGAGVDAADRRAGFVSDPDADREFVRLFPVRLRQENMGAIGDCDAVLRRVRLHFPEIRFAFQNGLLGDDAGDTFAVEKSGEVSVMLDEMRRLLACDLDAGKLRRFDVDVAMFAVVLEGNAARDPGNDAGRALHGEHGPAAFAPMERCRPFEMERVELFAIDCIDYGHLRVRVI